MTAPDRSVIDDQAASLWAGPALDALVRYIEVPNVSPMYDPAWVEHGHMDDAVRLLCEFAEARLPAGATLEVRTLPGRTPLILIEVPATPGAEGLGTVLLYGHLDKQPEMVGWRDGLGAWTPVVDGDRLYGRGGADDGYALFAALGAVSALEAAGGSHARCVIVIEASEESGSPDLPDHLEALGDRLGQLSLVVCLDSSSPTYDRWWVTTSLRGIVDLRLDVEVLDSGQHSGLAGGVVPSSFRIARNLLSRIEDADTGRILVDELHAEVPRERVSQMEAAGALLGLGGVVDFPFAGATRPSTGDDPVAAIRSLTWEPTLEVIAADGLPAIGSGGNVLRPSTSLNISFRLPPTVDAGAAAAALCQTLETDPPSGAVVRTAIQAAEDGWDAPPTAPWLSEALDVISTEVWGAPAGALGIGGSIPFMAMLGQRFPAAQFVVTGVLGPDSNAHGPNEYLHLPTAERVTAAVARLLAAHATS